MHNVTSNLFSPCHIQKIDSLSSENKSSPTSRSSFKCIIVFHCAEWEELGTIFPSDRFSLLLTKAVRKSQVAIEYAYRFQQSHPQSHIFWVYAASSARFVQAYEDIARLLKLPGWDEANTDSCKTVSKWLNEEDNHWLMILDNVDNADLSFHSIESDVPPITTTESQRPLVDYLPTNLDSRKSVIVTTRSKSLGMDLADGESCVEVKPFSSQEGETLLRSKLEGAADSFDTFTTERLLKILGYMPLAITQAAAFIKRTPMTVQDYLAALEKDDQNLKDFLSKDLQDHNSVFRTWELSFKQILKQDLLAAELLSLIAMLDPQRIPQKLLKRSAKKDVDFWTAIGTLDGFALISQEIGGEPYAIHPLVQASVHYWLEQRSEKADYTGKALRLLAEEFPSGKHEHKETCELLLAHAQAVLRYDCVLEDDLGHRAALLYNVGWFDWQQGRYISAYREAFEAYEIHRERLGEIAIITLNSLSLLALVLHYQGKYEASEEMNRRALKGREKVLGVEHPDTLTSVGNLASMLQCQGKYEAAEKMHRRALDGREKLPGDEHPDTLTSISNLASVLQYQGKYETAEEMNRQALNEREKLLGDEHPDTLISVNDLALVLRYQGKYETAEEMHRRALDGCEKVLGVEHPDTLISVYNLATLLHTQHRYHDASILYLTASAGFLKMLGPDHPMTRQCSRHHLSMIDEMKARAETSDTIDQSPIPDFIPRSTRSRISPTSPVQNRPRRSKRIGRSTTRPRTLLPPERVTRQKSSTHPQPRMHSERPTQARRKRDRSASSS